MFGVTDGWLGDSHVSRSLYEFLATPSPLLSQLVPAAALSGMLEEDEVTNKLNVSGRRASSRKR